MPNNFWMKELDEGIRSSITQKTDRARRIERGIKYDKACPLKLVDEALDISNDEKEDMTWRLHATTMAAMGAARIDNWELVEWCREQLAEGIQPDEDGEAILGDKYRLQLLAKVDKLLKAYKIASESIEVPGTREASPASDDAMNEGDISISESAATLDIPTSPPKSQG